MTATLLMAVLALQLATMVAMFGLNARVGRLESRITSLEGSLQALRGELRGEFATVRQEFDRDMSALRERVAKLEPPAPAHA